jgi:hypothetical protein
MTELIFVILVTLFTCGLVYWVSVKPKRRKRYKPQPVRLRVSVYTKKGLAEVVSFTRELTDAELKDLMQYLSLKWEGGLIEVVHTKEYI